MSIHLIQANAMRLPFPDDYFHCVVTSPPYWAKRRYTIDATVWGGDPNCAHEWIITKHNPQSHGDDGARSSTLSGSTATQEQTRFGEVESAVCAVCGAWAGQLGLEPTVEGYIANMVVVFREVRRVLRPDGVLWMNLGDSYAGSGSGKPKDLLLIPHRVALALQADGWWIRSTIIWHKPNVMPESVRDRPTTAHEYVFLLSKQPRYFYDAVAIYEPLAYPEAADGTRTFGGVHKHGANARQQRTTGRTYDNAPSGRNKRTVWSINTQAYHGAHFAAFPEVLVAPMVKAGTSEHGCCAQCGAPWERVTERASNFSTTGWEPTCTCGADPVPCRVFDPFCGTGVTLKVARDLGRHAYGTDLSPAYLAMARERTGLKAFDEWVNGIEGNADDYADLPLFAEVNR